MPRRGNGMHVKTILNRLYRHKSFVYGQVTFFQDGDKGALRVAVEARANGKPTCSGCGRRGPGYDRLQERWFQFVPLWGLSVFLVYRMRRVACPQCGVTVEKVPWAKGKSRQTHAFAWFLTFWAKRLPWQEVARLFRTNWQGVFAAVERAVEWGLARRRLEGVQAIGVDEVQWQKGHHYLTLVYQIEAGCKRLLHVALERTAASLRGFFEIAGAELAAGLRYACSDMWQPYLEVLGEQAPQAVHVLDRYLLVAQLNRAVDEIRRGEAKRLTRDGYEQVLKHSRWCLLKRPENLTAAADREIAGTAQIQPAFGARLFTQGGLPALLGVPLAVLGRTIPRRVVSTGDAFSSGAPEEGGPEPAESSAADPQLVPGPGHDLRRGRGGSELQRETDHEKSLWLSDVSRCGSRLVSPTW